MTTVLSPCTRLNICTSPSRHLLQSPEQRHEAGLEGPAERVATAMEPKGGFRNEVLGAPEKRLKNGLLAIF